MAIASDPAGPVLAGPVSMIVFENAHAQSAADQSKSCMRAYVTINPFIFALLQLHQAITKAVHNFIILEGGQTC